MTGHGTHVAGIAAGNGLGAKNGKEGGVYTGVAPKAHLIIVKGGNEQFYSDDIFNGISYMFQKAAAINPPRPIAVNLSVGGTQLGPHDGTSLFERGIDELLNWENGDGKVIVISAGNDGNKNIHFSGELSPGVSQDTVWVDFQVDVNLTGFQDYLSFDIWYYWYSSLSVSLKTPSGQLLGPVESGSKVLWHTEEGEISIDNASFGSGEDKELVINVYDGISPVRRLAVRIIHERGNHFSAGFIYVGRRARKLQVWYRCGLLYHKIKLAEFDSQILAGIWDGNWQSFSITKA